MENTNLENTDLLSVKERLIIFINYENLSQSKFEKAAGLSNGYVNNIKNSISDKIFDSRIHPAFPSLNKIWLLHGLGDMLNHSNSEEPPINIVSIKNKPHDEQMEMLYDKIEKLDNTIEKLDNTIEKLENTIEILKARDKLYFKAIIAHLGIDAEDEKDIEKNTKSSTN